MSNGWLIILIVIVILGWILLQNQRLNPSNSIPTKPATPSNLMRSNSTKPTTPSNLLAASSTKPTTPSNFLAASSNQPSSKPGTRELPNHSRITSGQSLMKRSKIILAGLIRDGAPRVPEMIARLETIGQEFADYQVIVVENDSIDGTRSLLTTWKQRNSRVHLLGCDDKALNSEIECILDLPATHNHDAGRSRIAKMAYLRNIYLDYVRKNFRHYDYLMVIDLDISGHFYLEGLADSFSHFNESPSIQALGANGIKWSGYWYYYDPFAFIEMDQPIEWKTLEDKQDHDWVIFARPVMSPGDPLYRVKSCFGGAVVYRLSALGNTRYDYSRKGYACEHSFFNRSFQMYLNPAMIFEVQEH